MAAPARALYFGPPGTECFGWLHAPDARARSGLGLVICSPFGDEDQSAYRGFRQLAMLAAEAGVATLRFDYAGSGDSAGADGEHDHPTAWLRSVHAAIETLREAAGVARICLLGARLGALPAAQAASERDDVCALVALAPVVRGRGFLREALLRTVRSSTGADADVELAGHTVTPRARTELAAIDLTELPPPAADVLVVDADSLRASQRWLAQLGRHGVRTETFATPALAGMLEGIGDVAVPLPTLARIVDWIAARADRAPCAGQVAMPVPPPAASLHLDGVRETPLTLRVGATGLFAILSEPAVAAPRRAVLLLNTGSARRIGPSRMHVTWARRWARAGIAVLRLDLPGLGDSGVQPGETEGEAYATDTTPAIAAAVALLHARFGPVGCQLMGICSGAHHAYRAALAGVPVESLVLINQAAYRWHAGMHLSRPTLALALAMRATWVQGQLDRQRPSSSQSGALRRVLSGLKWRTLQHGMAAFGLLRDAARNLHAPLPHDVGAALRALAQRGVAIHVVVSDGDSAGALLRIEAGREAAAMQRHGELQIDSVTDADHIFTTQSARARLQRVLDRIVHRPTRQPAGRRAPAKEATAAMPTPRTGSVSR